MFPGTAKDNAGQAMSAAATTPPAIIRNASVATAHIVLFTLSALLLSACAASDTQSQLSETEAGTTGQIVPLIDTLPALSELDAQSSLGSRQGHGPSVVLDKSLPGDEALLASELVELDSEAHVAVMHTGYSGFSYAIYRFDGFIPGEYPLSFAIERSPLGEGRVPSLPPPYSFCYAAWADFAAGRWRMFPERMPYTDPANSWVQFYPLDAEAVSAAGNSYLAVIMYGATVESPEVRSVTLYYTGDAQ